MPFKVNNVDCEGVRGEGWEVGGTCWDIEKNGGGEVGGEREQISLMLWELARQCVIQGKRCLCVYVTG